MIFEVIVGLITISAYILFLPILIGIIISLITWFVWAFSPNKDARDQAKITNAKYSHYINIFVEWWYINVVEKLFTTLFGFGFLVFAGFIIMAAHIAYNIIPQMQFTWEKQIELKKQKQIK